MAFFIYQHTSAAGRIYYGMPARLPVDKPAAQQEGLPVAMESACPPWEEIPFYRECIYVKNLPHKVRGFLNQHGWLIYFR